jgi:hypothetical protein
MRREPTASFSTRRSQAKAAHREDPAMNIDIPKPAAKPNKSRPINTLLQYQIKRLWEVEQLHVPAHRTGISIDPEKLHELTEGQAAEYIRRMTAKLRELGPKPKRTRKAAAKPKPHATL